MGNQVGKPADGGKDKKGEEDAVAKQAANFEKKGSSWNIIKEGTIDQLMTLFPHDCKFSLERRHAEQEVGDFHEADHIVLRNRRKAKASRMGLGMRVSDRSMKPDMMPTSYISPKTSARGEGTPRDGTFNHGRPAGAGEDGGGGEVVEDGSSNAGQLTMLTPGEASIYDRGPVGENVFHLSLLFNNERTFEMARYLVDVFGTRMINMPYQMRTKQTDKGGLFEGETSLHIVIVNKQVDMLRFLLKRGGDVRIRAFGTFFHDKPGQNCYFGEFPLSFAVCMDSREMVDMIMETGRVDLNRDKDSKGNTALHMAVFHSLPEMYDYLVDVHKADQTVRNSSGLTPFTMAAQGNNHVMFSHIYLKQRTIVWIYGPVTCLRLPLKEFDTVQTDDNDMTVSAIDVICSMGHKEMLSDEFIVKVLQDKWDKFAKWIFWVTLAAFLALLGVLSLLVHVYRSGGISKSPIVICKWSEHCQEAQKKHDDPEEGALDEVYGSILVIDPSTGETKMGVKGYDGRSTERWILEILNVVGALLFMALDVYDWYSWHIHYSRQKKIQRRAMATIPPIPMPQQIPGVDVEINKKARNSIAALRGFTTTFKNTKNGRKSSTGNLSTSAGGGSSESVGSKQGGIASVAAAAAAAAAAAGPVAEGRGGVRDKKIINTREKIMAKQKSLRKKSDSFFAKIAKVNKVEATDATLAFDADGDGMIDDEEAAAAEAAGLVHVSEGTLVATIAGFMRTLFSQLHPTACFLWIYVALSVVHFEAFVANKGPYFGIEGVELALAVFSGWCYLLYFVRAIQRFGHLVVMMVLMLVNDVFKFGLIFIILLTAFSEAMTVLIDEEWMQVDVGNVGRDYATIVRSMLTLFRFTLGDITYDTLREHDAEGLVVALFIAWSVISNIMMINLLIAMMGNTFATVSGNALLEYRLQWARMILLIERRLPRQWRLRHRLGEEVAPGEYAYIYQVVDSKVKRRKVTVGHVDLDRPMDKHDKGDVMLDIELSRDEVVRQVAASKSGVESALGEVRDMVSALEGRLSSLSADRRDFGSAEPISGAPRPSADPLAEEQFPGIPERDLLMPIRSSKVRPLPQGGESSFNFPEVPELDTGSIHATPFLKQPAAVEACNGEGMVQEPLEESVGQLEDAEFTMKLGRGRTLSLNSRNTDELFDSPSTSSSRRATPPPSTS